jgi:transcriptional regulator with XRE-family HTH domain
MVAQYKDRLAQAMKLAGVSEHQLAKALDITYTGVKKALKGGHDGTSAMSAANNSKAAKFLGVDPDWLATGEGDSSGGIPPLSLTLDETDLIIALRERRRPAATATDNETDAARERIKAAVLAHPAPPPIRSVNKRREPQPARKKGGQK